MEPEKKIIKKVPKVSSIEVETWEENFRGKVSPLVQFDEQDNKYSMKFYNGESGIDAYWSGIIILKNDDYLKWNYSALNGVMMDCKMSLDETNKKIPTELYDFFVLWQADVLKTITSTKPEDAGTPAPAPLEQPAAALAGPETTNAPPMPGTQQLAEGDGLINLRKNAVNHNIKNVKRESAIMDSAERMRRLAGL